MPDFNFDDINPLVDHTPKKAEPPKVEFPNVPFENYKESETDPFGFPSAFGAPTEQPKPEPKPEPIVEQNPMFASAPSPFGGDPFATTSTSTPTPIVEHEPEPIQPTPAPIPTPQPVTETPRPATAWQPKVQPEALKCPSCGSSLEWNGADKTVTCRACGHTIAMNQYQPLLTPDQFENTEPDILDRFDPKQVEAVDAQLSKLIAEGRINDIPKLKYAFDQLRLPYAAILSKKLGKTGDAALNSDGICESANAILIGGQELSL